MYEPTGIVFAGDWHENQWWGETITMSAAANECDTIIQVGDYGYRFDPYFNDHIEAACSRYGVTIYFVDGNHDDHGYIWAQDMDEDGFFIISEHVRGIPRGKRWQWWGKTFLGLGGAVSVDKKSRKQWGVNREWWDTETVSTADAYKAVEGGKVDVMVTHDCPAFVNIPGINAESDKFWPADVIAEANEHRKVLWRVWHEVKPNLLVHGHYHRYYETEYGGTHVIGLDMDGTSWQRNTYVARGVDDLT